MNNKFLRSVVAGIVATIAMSAMMMIAAQLGMPKMEPPKMLATTMGASVAIGWIMHFMIGIIFALIYSFIIKDWLTKITSSLGKGVVFGIIAFVMAQISMGLMMQIFPTMPTPSGNMIVILMGGLIGHILFGIVVAAIVNKKITS
ncbi:DUF6789 family protein [Winogradskyella costae]|uniref:DUF6789 family protein n=1 Tax=Winogradskyella costae TaxID=2697008 RepID=UPI0015CE7C39|nr:DUF6789 family protein [Winogradskyella costae]